MNGVDCISISVVVDTWGNGHIAAIALRQAARHGGAQSLVVEVVPDTVHLNLLALHARYTINHLAEGGVGVRLVPLVTVWANDLHCKVAIARTTPSEIDVEETLVVESVDDHGVADGRFRHPCVAVVCPNVGIDGVVARIVDGTTGAQFFAQRGVRRMSVLHAALVVAEIRDKCLVGIFGVCLAAVCLVVVHVDGATNVIEQFLAGCV